MWERFGSPHYGFVLATPPGGCGTRSSGDICWKEDVTRKQFQLRGGCFVVHRNLTPHVVSHPVTHRSKKTALKSVILQHFLPSVCNAMRPTTL